VSLPLPNFGSRWFSLFGSSEGYFFVLLPAEMWVEAFGALAIFLCRCSSLLTYSLTFFLLARIALSVSSVYYLAVCRLSISALQLSAATCYPEPFSNIVSLPCLPLAGQAFCIKSHLPLLLLNAALSICSATRLGSSNDIRLTSLAVNAMVVFSSYQRLLCLSGAARSDSRISSVKALSVMAANVQVLNTSCLGL